MKSTVVIFVCVLYCCHAAAVIKEGKDVVIDGVLQSVPAVTVVTTESTKLTKDSPGEKIQTAIGPTLPPSTKPTTATPSPTTTNATTVTPSPTTTNATTVTPSPTTTNATTVTPSPTTTNATTVTPSPTTTNATTVTPSPSTTNGTTPVTPTKPTTAKPIPSSTVGPITSTTAPSPGNRGFDGPSFIGGIVLASGLMAIGFVALKFYRARTELNYHTL